MGFYMCDEIMSIVSVICYLEKYYFVVDNKAMPPRKVLRNQSRFM